MKTFTIEQVFKALRGECVPAPLNTAKIIRALSSNEELMHKALDMYAEGKLNEYHMLPGNGKLEF